MERRKETLITKTKKGLAKGNANLKKPSLPSAEARWKSIVDNSLEMIVVIDKKGTILSMNHYLPELKEEEVIGTSMYKFVLPENKEKIEKVFALVFKTGTSQFYESTGPGPGNSLAFYESRVMPIKEGDKTVAVTLITKDVTKTKTSATLLKESEEKFRKLADSTFEAIIIHDKGKILESNRSANELFQYNELEMLKLTALDLAAEESKILVKYRISLQDKTGTPYEFMGLKKDGSTFLCEIVAGEIPYKNIKARVAALRDISFKKKAEDDLKKSRENYRNLVEFSPDGIFIHDQMGHVVFANPSGLKMCGIKSLEELKNTHIFDYVLPEYHEAIKAGKNRLEEGEPLPFFEIKMKRPDGTILEIEAKPIALKYDDKKSTLIVCHDIAFQRQLETEQLRTKIAEENNIKLQQEIIERKNAQRNLFLSQKNTRLLIESSIDIIYATNKEGIITEFNPAAYNAFGYAGDEIIGKHVEILFSRPQERKTIIEEQLYKRGSYGIALENKRKNGEVFVAYISTSLLKNEPGEIIGTMSISRDITETRKAQEKLMLSEENYRDLFENATDMIQSIDMEGSLMFVNQAWKNTLLYNEREIQTLNFFSLVHPAFKQKCSELFEKLLLGETPNKCEIALITKNNDTILVEGNISLKTKDQKPESVRGIFRNITERKLAEEKIRLSEEKYRAIYDQAIIGIAQVSITGNFLQVNQKMCDITGYSKEELIVKSLLEITFPENPSSGQAFIYQLVRGQISNFSTEIKHFQKDGSVIYSNLSVSLVRNADEKPDYFIAVLQDITQRKKAEEHIEIQASKLNAIIESGPHIIWTVNRNRELTAFNINYAELIYGIYGEKPYVDAVISGKYVSTKDYKEIDKRYESAFMGIPQHFETCIKYKNETEIWREIYLNPIYDSNNNVTEVSGIGHDITEKKASEAKITQSLKEKEVLLKEVHHRVKNNLQVISSILNLQSSYIKDDKTLNLLKESQNRIKSMAFIHESLYQTKDFSRINFSEYIVNLSKNLVHSYSGFGNEIELKLETDSLFLNIDLAIPCGLIINELVSNSLKYAFPREKNGEIHVTLKAVEDQVFLSIADNGVGMPKEIDYRNTESLGLQLVMALTDQLNGKIELINKEGTQYNLTFKHILN